MQPGDRLVCAFVQPVATGLEFKQWPLHVTIVPWFRTEVSPDALATEFSEKLVGRGAFEVVMDGEARFGRNKLVNLVEQPTPFMEVEKQVREVLKEHDSWIVDETTQRKRSYRPHVTEQKNERLYQSDTFTCGQLYIVEQKGNFKQVISVIKLS